MLQTGSECPMGANKFGEALVWLDYASILKTFSDFRP